VLVTVFILFLLPAGALSAEGQSEESAQPEQSTPVEIEMVVPTGVPAISVANMVDGTDSILDGYSLDLEVVTSPDVMGSRLLAGEADIAIVPTNLGARLYNRDIDVRYAAGVVWGILYVVADGPVADWDELRGREVGMLGRGLTPDLVFRHIAKTRGLDPDADMTLRYVNATTELAPNFLGGEVDVSIMPEPMLTRVLRRSEEARVVFDLQQEWAEATETGRGFPQASLVLAGDLADEHPEFAAAFLEAFAESVTAAGERPVETAARAAELIPQLSPGIIEEAMPRTNLEFVEAEGAREAVEAYFAVLLESDPDTLGGPVPGDDFYYRP
jgi:NitT/TauT family transport system substrate-binding protein